MTPKGMTMKSDVRKKYALGNKQRTDGKLIRCQVEHFVLSVGWLKEWGTTPKTKSKSRRPVVASGQNEDLKCAEKRVADKDDGKGLWQADFKFRSNSRLQPPPSVPMAYISVVHGWPQPKFTDWQYSLSYYWTAVERYRNVEKASGVCHRLLKYPATADSET